MPPQKIATIGYTKKSLRHFVELLQKAGISKVIDIRRHNTSQLAGFSKKGDLDFILSLLGIEYEHHPQLAPTEEMLKRYHADKNWDEYQQAYLKLLHEGVDFSPLKPSLENQGVICLLCTEESPEHCHRRLLAEYISRQLPQAEVVHLQ